MKKIKMIVMVLLLALIFTAKMPNIKTNEIILNANEPNDQRELKGVWVTPITGDVSINGEYAFKNSMTNVLDVMEYYGLNALMFHVRTHNNALYPSELNPKSSSVSSINFNSFDPIEWLISETHKRGIEFHAWMNPYRVSTSTQASPLPAINPQSNSANLIIEGSSIILNPDKAVVRNHIYDTIEEFITRYPNIDAIHFDDYFYIQTSVAPTSAAAKRANIDMLIEGVHNVLTDFNNQNNTAIQFGISPTGIYRNGNGIVTYDYDGKPITNGSNTGGQEHYASYLFADTVKWATNEWIDYLAPQVYWARNHSLASFTKIIDWWDKVFKYLNVNLYSGIGVYMADNSGTFGWQTDMFEMDEQLTMIENKDNVKGYGIYAYKHLYNGYNNSQNNSGQQIRNAYQTEDRKAIRVLPEVRTMTPVIPGSVTNVSHINGTLNWDATSDAKFYYIYRSSSELTYSSDEIVGAVGDGLTSFTTSDYSNNYNYGVKALSRTNHLSGAPVETPVETYSITYNLNGGKLPGYNNKKEMVDAFLSDFYDFVDPAESLNDFMHGAGNSSGYAGTWNTDHKEFLYAANIKTGNDAYFLSHYLYQDKWAPFANFMDEMIKNKNSAQSFWGSTFVGNQRLGEYIKETSPWTPDELAMMPEGLTIINSYNENMNVILPIPEKQGNEFYGWYLDASFTNGPIYIIEKGTTGDIDLYARFSLPLASYKVEYDLGYDNLTLPDMYVLEGDYASNIPVNDRYLHNFLGWAKEGSSVVFDFNTPITSNIKLVALWETLEEMTVSFDLDYPGAINPSNVKLGKGRKLAIPEVPVREGYAFLGWYKDNVLYDFNSPVLTNFTLVAKWNDPTFSLTFDLNGGYLEALDLISYTNNTKVVATRYSNGIDNGTPITIGYARPGIYWTTMAFKDTDIEGVYELIGKGSGYTNPNATLYISYHGQVAGIYANIIKDIYANIEVGSLLVVPELPEELSITNVVSVDMYFLSNGMPSEIVLPSNEVSGLLTPKKNGQDFGGWYLNSNFTGEKVTEVPHLTNNLTLYAKWLDETVTVNFDLNYPGATANDPVVLNLNERVTKPTDPTRAGFIFLGWYLNDELYNFNNYVTTDITLVAKWQEETSAYLITYELNGGEFVSDYNDKYEMIEDFLKDFYNYLDLTSSFTEFKHGTGNTTGYDGQWHSVHSAKIYSGPRPTAVNNEYFASSAKYMAKWLPFFDMMDDFVKIVNSDQYFWGEGTWTGLIRIREYIIDDLPDGNQTPEDMQMMPKEYKVYREYENLTEAIILKVPVKDELTFLGWYTNPSFTGSPVTQINIGSTGNLTFYAKWDEEIYYNITFDSLGGTFIDHQQVAFGQTVTKPSDPTKYGHVFAGWYIDNVLYDFNSLVFEDLVLEAKWIADSVTDLVTAIDGASIRTEGTQGLRFYATIKENVKNNEHGFYLIYGTITKNQLEVLINNNINLYHGKEIFKVVIPGIKEVTNEFSVVLTGIPVKGYIDKITVVPYVKVAGNIVLADEVVTRSVAEVAFKALKKNEPVENIINDINSNLLKEELVDNNLVFARSTIYETNTANLKEAFYTDWNSLFNTNFTNPTSIQFYTNARLGTSGQAAGNTSLRNANIYEFFNHPNFKDKWGFLLEFLESVDYTIHTTNQIKAIQGDGTYYNVERNTSSLYNAIHLSYSIYNFFNVANERGGYPAIDFTINNIYDDLDLYNESIVKKEINVYDYVLLNAVITLKEINLTPPAGKVYKYFDGTNYYSPLDSYVVREETLQIVLVNS